jgi:SPX domain protein involved in polyphosphate accumulation
MKKTFLPCEEANIVCDKSQYSEASFMEIIKLNLHLLYCKACRTYSANNAKLSQLFKKVKPATLQADQKNKLQKEIEEQLKKQ